MADIYCAKEAFAFTDKKGVPRVVAPGDLISSDDPNFKGKEHLFEAVQVAAARQAAPVEEATAEPGVLRSVSTVPDTKRRGRPPKSDSADEPKKSDKE